MEPKAVEQIHLCLNELQMIKQLVDLKVADDFCSRLLAIYAMLRVDDITKIWSHNIPRDMMERCMADDVKKQYNAGLRTVRDKLGAHYQASRDANILFDSVNLFKSIDYANTVCLIDALVSVQTQIEKREIVPQGFCETADLSMAKNVLQNLYSDDRACITTGALDLFGINKGGLISCSKEQAKAQVLRSIEVMTEVACALYSQPYVAAEVKRMFKRLYVTMVYNYHDNLITRTDIKDKAVQYEEGFDILFKNLITKQDDKAMLESAFDEFEAIYQVGALINKYRDVRNKSCAHFDENSTAEEINGKLDALDAEKLDDAYRNMLNMFNYICNNVFCLQMMAISARTPIYGARMETIRDNEDFYGEKPDAEMPREMSLTDIMRSLRRQDEKYDEACYALRFRLMSNDEQVYKKTVSEIISRLREPALSGTEQSAIINAFSQAKRGYPKRLQCTLLGMMCDTSLKKYGIHFLWLLSSLCVEDSEIDIPAFLRRIISQEKFIPAALSLLAMLHLTVHRQHSCIVSENKPHAVSEEIKSLCESIAKPTERCALMLVLCQHWFYGDEFSAYRVYERQYSDYLELQMPCVLEGYFTYIKQKNTELYRKCLQYLATRHYLLLLYYLVCIESERNQHPNIFLDMWRCNCFILVKSDLYEALAVALITEHEGDIIRAKEIMETLVKENPINRDAINTLEDFYKRNLDIRS
ncbi:MAG: hypothetical protein NC388_09305 [Clostridium sp.]|nr:hypothetical protein [Clostridium sp.]